MTVLSILAFGCSEAPEKATPDPSEPETEEPPSSEEDPPPEEAVSYGDVHGCVETTSPADFVEFNLEGSDRQQLGVGTFYTELLTLVETAAAGCLDTCGVDEDCVVTGCISDSGALVDYGWTRTIAEAGEEPEVWTTTTTEIAWSVAPTDGSFGSLVLEHSGVRQSGFEHSESNNHLSASWFGGLLDLPEEGTVAGGWGAWSNDYAWGYSLDWSDPDCAWEWDFDDMDAAKVWRVAVDGVVLDVSWEIGEGCAQALLDGTDAGCVDPETWSTL